jgi:hypothetical protein
LYLASMIVGKLPQTVSINYLSHSVSVVGKRHSHSHWSLATSGLFRSDYREMQEGLLERKLNCWGFHVPFHLYRRCPHSVGDTTVTVLRCMVPKSDRPWKLLLHACVGRLPHCLVSLSFCNLPGEDSVLPFEGCSPSI